MTPGNPRVAESPLLGVLLACITGLLADIGRAEVQADGILTAETVLESSHTHFPRILQSLAQRRGAAGKALEADGAFDLVFAADGFSRVGGFYDGTAVSGIARQNFGPLGSSLYAGYSLSDGDFPIYEDEYFTNTGGQLKVGLLFSLLRDRDIDERRFRQQDADYALRMADLDVLLTKIGVQQRALVAYWRWVAAGRQLGVYEDLLRIAQEREAGLEEQVRRGARAEIFLVENRRNITRRQVLATRARRDFRVAANALSYYYRDQSGAPSVPAESRLPPAPPIGSLDESPPTIGEGTSDALARRPELELLRASIERVRNRVALAENSLRPRLDLNVEVAHGLGSVAEGGPSRDSTDTIVGFDFSLPLQRREARGKLWQEEAEIEALRQERRLKQEQIEVEVSNILLELRYAGELLGLAGQEVEQADVLRDAEQRRFESGASDFFLVNLREETAANARIQYYDAELGRRVARANYDAATVDLPRLGIVDGAAPTAGGQ